MKEDTIKKVKKIFKNFFIILFIIVIFIALRPRVYPSKDLKIYKASRKYISEKNISDDFHINKIDSKNNIIELKLNDKNKVLVIYLDNKYNVINYDIK